MSIPIEEILARKLPPQANQSAMAEENAKQEQEYVTATFQGLYFKGVASGKEAVPFKVNIKVPFECIRNPAYHPAWVMQKLASKLFGKDTAYGGLRNFELTVTSKLPTDLNPLEHLNWTAGYYDLVALIKRYATDRVYHPLDPSEGTPLPSQKVSVVHELFSTPASLRNAIKRCINDPEAFDKEQKKLLKKWDDKDTKATRALDNELMQLNM